MECRISFYTFLLGAIIIHGIRNFLLVAITALLAACGGGGGGDDGTPSFVGNYSVNASLASNNCNAAVPGVVVGTSSIAQSGRSVTISGDLGDGAPLTGSVDADNGGLTVTHSQVSSGVTVLTVFNYRTVTAGSNYSVQVSITAGTCSAIYKGTAVKI